MSEQTMWAVKGTLTVWPSVRATENEAINAVVEFSGVPWETLQKIGYRTMQYRITEVPDGA